MDSASASLYTSGSNPGMNDSPDLTGAPDIRSEIRDSPDVIDTPGFSPRIDDATVISGTSGFNPGMNDAPDVTDTPGFSPGIGDYSVIIDTPGFSPGSLTARQARPSGRIFDLKTGLPNAASESGAIAWAGATSIPSQWMANRSLCPAPGEMGGLINLEKRPKGRARPTMRLPGLKPAVSKAAGISTGRGLMPGVANPAGTSPTRCPNWRPHA